MKSFLLLLSLAWFGTLFAQETTHFLIKSHSSIRITDPICKKMAEDSKKEIQTELSRIKDTKKNGDFNITKQPLELQSFFEAFQTIGNDPENNFASLAILNILINTFRESDTTPIYLSLQKVTLKTLGEATIEISINNVQVSSSETAMDITVKNLRNTSAPIQTMHFSCSTGRLLLANEASVKFAWINYWGEFYKEAKVIEWLEKAVNQVEPSLIGKSERERRTDVTLKQLGITTTEYLFKGIEQVKAILKGLPYKIPYDEIVAVLISKDEQKISLLNYYETALEVEDLFSDSEDEINYFQESYTYSATWNLEKKDGNWNIYISENDSDDSLASIRTFYQAAISTDNRLNEEKWIEEKFNEFTYLYSNHVEIVREASTPEVQSLIANEIQPKLAKLYNDKSSTYTEFYQRISPEQHSYWGTETEQIVTKDFLISNPEKTAFIYPVLLSKESINEEWENEDNSEDFKFFVLLKNQDGSYKLYDWFYFKTMEYSMYYELMNCAASHLSHKTDYNSGQEVINDQAFWDNFVYKRSARGFDYLIEVVLANESISISSSEFDSQVQDCIEILLEYDVVDLYEHQLKQIIRCINTIQKGSLNGTQNLKLITLSQELHFQKRLNKIQKADGNYYPSLNIELGTPWKEYSYYRIR